MGIFIIAEIGINHNADIGIARDLIDLAKFTGCDAVKFQKRTPELCVPEDKRDVLRASPWGVMKTIEYRKKIEFGQEEFLAIDSYCKEVGIEWFASAWDIEAQKFLRQFDCKYNKIASAMVVDLEFVKEVASEGKYTFISTGMCEMSDIEKAVGIFIDAGCSFELMHCISTYPMDDTDANLNCIKTLKDKFGCSVGYSGHEVGLAVSYAAAALGISSLERHITLDRAMPGSDHSASVEPGGLKQLVGAVRKIEKAMGDGVVCVHEKEVSVAKKLRMHINWDANE